MMLADGSGSGSSGTPHTSTHGLKSQTRLPAAASNGTRQMATESVNGSTNGKAPMRGGHSTPYYGHDREEITRILIQALSEMGYHTAADSVTRESGYELENGTVTDFRTAIEDGAWGHAERLLSEATIQGRGPPGEGLVLKPGCDRTVMKFSIRKQKFLELLEQSDTTGALQVLRTELTPLYQDREQLQALSSLMMCHSPEDLRAKADWDGAGGQSRHTLLKDLSSESPR
jgi:WD repeat-containing protein 26